MQIIYGFFCSADLLSFLHTIQSNGQCTNAFPAALIFRINLSHSNFCIHTSLSLVDHITLCYVIMESQRVRRPEGPQDWEAQREVITDLYITKGLELEDLMKTMEDDHFFKATYDHVNN